MYKLLLCLPCSNGQVLNLKLLYETIPSIGDGWWFPYFADDESGGLTLEYEPMTVTTISHQAGCINVFVDGRGNSEDLIYENILLGSVGWFPEVDCLRPGWEIGTPAWKTLSEITGRESAIVV